MKKEKIMNVKHKFCSAAVVAMLSLSILIVVMAPAVADPGWLSRWSYREPVNISSSSELTDYQVLVTEDTASLIFDGKMQLDGDDIRFTDSGGTTLLNYWIESGINTASTKIWVNVPSVPTGETIIYMYYGNTGASSVSNGAATFEFFDDFESYDDGLDITGQGGWTTKRIGGTGYAKVSTKNGKKHLCLSSTSEGTVVVHAYSSPGSLCLGSRAYRESAAAEAYSPGFGDGSVVTVGLAGLMMNGYMTIWYGWGGETSSIYESVSGTPNQIGATASGTSAQGTYYLFDFVWDGNNLRSYRDGSLILSGTDTTYSSQTHVHLSSWGTSIWDTDWIFIRKYADPEPGVTIGIEEEEPSQPIPEFSTMAIPVVSILGLLFLFNYRKKRRN